MVEAHYCFNTNEEQEIALFDSLIEMDSCIHGHHMYNDAWTPVVDEE